VIVFGKRHSVAVTFTQRSGLWHAHAALLPNPQRHIRVARQIVARRLAQVASDAVASCADESEYRIAFVRESGEWDVVSSFRAADDAAANAYAETEYGQQEWYVLDSTGRNINGGAA